MLTFTEADVLGWVTPILWPFLRVLALFTTMPLFSERSVPARVRIALAFLIAFCAGSLLVGAVALAEDGRSAASTSVQADQGVEALLRQIERQPRATTP